MHRLENFSCPVCEYGKVLLTGTKNAQDGKPVLVAVCKDCAQSLTITLGEAVGVQADSEKRGKLDFTRRDFGSSDFYEGLSNAESELNLVTDGECMTETDVEYCEQAAPHIEELRHHLRPTMNGFLLRFERELARAYGSDSESTRKLLHDFANTFDLKIPECSNFSSDS